MQLTKPFECMLWLLAHPRIHSPRITLPCKAFFLGFQMFRRSSIALTWRAKVELDKARTLLRGRAKLERKLGIKFLFTEMRKRTAFRVELEKHQKRAIVRKNVDAAAAEHGTGWIHIRNDLARQNVVIMPRAQQLLAQYEPLAFRSVLELCSSNIAPPPSPTPARIPAEAYVPRPADPSQPTAASVVELEALVSKMMSKDSKELSKHGYRTPQEWTRAWEEFDIGKKPHS